jgi:competence protein ComK
MKYEINNDTQTILPVNYNSSKIIENGNQYIIEENPYSIIERSCEYFGSSYIGRKSGTKTLLGITHKAPIIVEESRGIIFFPTKSPDSSECVWINLGQVGKYYSVNKHTSAIEFKNGDILELDISIGSLTNQVLRASRLKIVLDERIKLKKI